MGFLFVVGFVVGFLPNFHKIVLMFSHEFSDKTKSNYTLSVFSLISIVLRNAQHRSNSFH